MTVVSTRKNRLSKMAFDFVSLVPAGDDPMAQVVISKADPTQMEDEGMTQIKKEDLAPEVVEYIDALEVEVDELTKSLVEAEDALDAIAKGDPDKDSHEVLLAKADPAVRALFEAQAEAIAKAEAVAKAERDERLNREFISKAEAMPMLSENPTELAGLLRRASEALSPEDNALLAKTLTTANEHIAKGSLFAEFGSSGQETTISKSVMAQAEEIRKANPALTIEQATAEVYTRNPDLFAQSLTQEA